MIVIIEIPRFDRTLIEYHKIEAEDLFEVMSSTLVGSYSIWSNKKPIYGLFY